MHTQTMQIAAARIQMQKTHVEIERLNRVVFFFLYHNALSIYFSSRTIFLEFNVQGFFDPLIANMEAGLENSFNSK